MYYYNVKVSGIPANTIQQIQFCVNNTTIVKNICDANKYNRTFVYMSNDKIPVQSYIIAPWGVSEKQLGVITSEADAETVQNLLNQNTTIKQIVTIQQIMQQFYTQTTINKHAKNSINV